MSLVGGQSHLWMASHAILMQISKYFLSALFHTLFPTLGFAEKGPLLLPPKSAIWSIMAIEGVSQLREPSGVSRLRPWGELSTGAEGRVSRSVWSNNNNQRILELDRKYFKSKPFLPPISRVLWGQWPLLSDLANPWQISKIKRSARKHFWPF